MRGEAFRWFDEAVWDYETALILYRNKRRNAACFYAHQAAEKAVKALLYSVNEAAFGPSLRMLLERYFRKLGVEPDEKLLRDARELDRHYIPSRYPNAHPAGTPHEAYDRETALEALRASYCILLFAGERLGRRPRVQPP